MEGALIQYTGQKTVSRNTPDQHKLCWYHHQQLFPASSVPLISISPLGWKTRFELNKNFEWRSVFYIQHESLVHLLQKHIWLKILSIWPEIGSSSVQLLSFNWIRLDQILTDFYVWLQLLDTAQWEFGRPPLTPTYLEDITEVKVD